MGRKGTSESSAVKNPSGHGTSSKKKSGPPELLTLPDGSRVSTHDQAPSPSSVTCYKVIKHSKGLKRHAITKSLQQELSLSLQDQNLLVLLAGASRPSSGNRSCSWCSGASIAAQLIFGETDLLRGFEPAARTVTCR